MERKFNLFLLFCFMAISTIAMAQTENVAKSLYPIKGYRTFVEGGMGVEDNGSYTVSISTIHGGQIIPQLYVGAGLMFNTGTYKTPDITPDIYSGKWDMTINELIPLLSVRYDILERKVSPFIEGRLGYRMTLSTSRLTSSSTGYGTYTRTTGVDDAEYGKLYISPSVGVRIRHFNIAVGLDITNVSSDVTGKYQDVHIEENLMFLLARMSFDFGARR